jgi:hypothetical protein
MPARLKTVGRFSGIKERRMTIESASELVQAFNSGYCASAHGTDAA